MTLQKIELVFDIILAVLSALMAYNVLLAIVGFFARAKKFPDTDKKFKYAVVITARNEERVIAQCIDSIKKQNYPQNLLTIFVVAHNCTDKTAEIARQMGAVVYELNDPNPRHHRLGYALKYLMEKINADYENGAEHFDGYLKLDADNLIAPNYIAEMTKPFANPKYDYVVSYISDKNVDEKCVGTFCDVGVYSTAMMFERPRAVLGLPPRIRGRATLVRAKLWKDGYPWLTYGDDTQMCNSFIANGYNGTYCETAELFDENPHTFRVCVRQRMRWVRGGYHVFIRDVWKLMFRMIFPRGRGRRIRKRLACYDRIFIVFPYPVVTFTLGFLFPLGVAIYSACIGAGGGAMVAVLMCAKYYGLLYLGQVALYFLVIFREKSHIRTNPLKLLRFVFVWPLIMIYLQFVFIYVLFAPVKWKPIPHTQGSKVDELTAVKTLSQALARTVPQTPAQSA